jgi:hypothetical protein
MQRLLTLLMIICSIKGYSTYYAEGKVIDKATKEPLAFVSIVIKGTQQAAYTSIEGTFKISSETPIKGLVFSYVGYTRFEYHITNENLILIAMEAKDHVLNEVNITAGENPAHRIIRRASQNRKRNDPDRIGSYKCTIYSKTYYDLVRHDLPKKDSTANDSLRKPIAAKKDSVQPDRTAVFLKYLVDESHLFMMESVYERKYLSPGHLNETVLATKASGLKNPSFSASATDLQPFSFYEDYFNMLGKDYLNPITGGSTTKYFFQLEDTLYQDADSVFIISFRPLKDKNFNGLKGLLYINTNGYAIQNVIAEPFDKGLMELKVQQQYQLVNGTQWFPQQLNYELFYKNYPSKTMGMKLTGKSFIKDVQPNANLKKRDFDFATVTMDPEASFQDSSYWIKNRPDTLSTKEKLTYHLLDSVGQKNNFDRKLKLVEALTTFQLPISIINLDLNRIVSANDYETVRLGLGAHTNERFSKWFTVGGYAGYGFRDKALKYGGDARLYFKRNSKDYYLQYSYSDDIAEPGKSRYFYSTTNLTRNLMSYRMDHVIQQEACFNFRAFKYMTMNVALNQNQHLPTYPYQFYEDVFSAPAVPVFNSTEFRIKGRYAYQEKLVQSFGQLISSGSKYPILHFAFTSGFKTPGYGNYRFNKVSAGIEKTFLIKNVGKTNILLEAGKMEGTVPYPYLFNGNGSFTKDGYLYVQHTFQTMGLYEFLSDQYVNLFLSHNFGTLLFKTEKHRPEFVVFTNIGYGRLHDSTRHQGIDFKTMEKGYYESGLMINNIVRANYLNVFYLGLGGGAFMRYGAYANKKWEDNMAYKLSLTVTF